MEASAPPNPADLLPKTIYYQLARALRVLRPPPVADTPLDEVHRDDHAAITQAASLLPANAEEADVIAQYVAAKAQALDCIRLARVYPDDAAHVLKCTAQAAGMMRQALRWRALLQRLKAVRQRPADAATTPLASPEPEPEPAANLHDPSVAEAYALAHPSEAALIRSLGRLPKKFNGDPLSPQLVHDIVNSASPILQALAKRPRHSLAAAAS
jgi:hypothetical protein